MIDGAALGTLRIGLDSARIASEWPDESLHRPARRSRATHSTFRVRVATTLRFVADRLDRSPSPALESSSSAA
jgi:hypothetical protein